MPRLVSVLVPSSLLSLLAGAASAQLPGLPTAPGAFVRPGIAVAANAGVETDALPATDGGGGRRSRWTYGGAAAFARGGGRWQVAGGVAAQSWGDGYQSPATALGARGAFAAWRGARLGATAFAGIGLARARLAEVEGAGDDPAVVSLRQLPVGAAVGMRGAWGGGARAWSVAVAPQYVWYRLAVGEDEVTDARPRVGLLAEVGLTPRLGVSVAYEDGARAAAGDPGPRGGTFGLALSFALGGW
ncbi:hypothetical protein [Roseisolibacter sp. H3M3-2]|uniref:hypothetical protein n=1 Tax=Roseisolibacter sp. H3M3-2 TaxID=3031323 RepID=UPI0023DBD75E|nr:hypothetical protein [Roseisolibacter sp. H3M3-2]MDF1501977.1 hypothetical protein [Roseisolibacter sp. H3M3-2]